MILDYLFNQDLESAAEQYGISNTDPIRSSSAKFVTVSKSHYFRAPGMTFAEAQADTQNVKTPLVYSAREIVSSTAQFWGVTYDANGAVLLENDTIPDWNEQNMLRIQLEGSCSVSATDQNWGEYDNISLRYGGLAMSEITLDGTENQIVVYWWKDLFTMQQLFKPYTLNKN